MSTIADFTINGDPSSNAGYDAANAQVLTLQLENLPATDVSRVQWSVTQASYGCPALTFSPPSGEPATVGGTVTLTAPATGSHAFVVACVVNNGVDASGQRRTDFYSFRQVVIRTPIAGLAKISPAERAEYDPTDGWTRKVNELVDVVESTSGGVLAATSLATPNTLVLRDGSAGAAFGYVDVSSYIGIGATPATSGALKLANATQQKWRNAGNTADVDGIGVDNADKLLLGDGVNALGAALSVNAGSSIDFGFGANVRLSFRDTLVEFQPSATMAVKQADALAGAGATATITTQRGALATDQCGALVVDIGDDTTDSPPCRWTTRSLGDVLQLQYVAADLGTQFTTGYQLGLRSVGLIVDPGDDGADTTNDIRFTAPNVGNWLWLRCNNAVLGSEIEAASALWLRAPNELRVEATGAGAVGLWVNNAPQISVTPSGAELFGGAGYGSGTGVLSIKNATTNPTTNPTGGALLYADGGALKGRGSGGTTTTFAPAEPHCPTCGRDFAMQWEHDNGEELAICMCCLVDTLEQLTSVNFAFKRRLNGR